MNHQDMNAAQFAKICNTQKSTLLFYDKEGLLKPKSVLDNGYRCYDFEQYYDYELICLLKDTGASLKEIKRYINNMDGQEFLDFLMLRHQQVKLDIKNLTDRKHMLEDMISTVKEASSATYDKISIEQCQREEYEILKCEDDSDPDENFKAYMEREASLKEKSLPQVQEYEEEEDQAKKEPVENSILTLITPLRRNAAAQVIESVVRPIPVIQETALSI